MGKGSIAGATLALFLAHPSLAQRTDDNAVTAAEDAFGKSVGDQSIGIYSPGDVRGFSPVDAGNVRIEGLFFDQVTRLSDRILGGSTVRVGVSAQNYPFPAPTGIADFELRKPGKDASASFGFNYGDFNSVGGEVDVVLPLDGARLGLAGGIGVYRDRYEYGGSVDFLTLGLVGRYAPTSDIEVVPFVARVQGRDEEARPIIFSAGPYLPTRYPRARFFGQPWADDNFVTWNFGTLARATFGRLELRGGIFRSVYQGELESTDLLFDTDQNGRVGRRIVVQERGSSAASTSGEGRASYTIPDGKRRHTLIASVRARSQERRYGGAVLVDLGPSQTGVEDFRPAPAVAPAGAKTLDRVRQTTFGLAYQGRWAGVGELGLGIQKTQYRKRVTDPNPAIALPETRDAPWLFSATGALYVTPSLAVYAGYTRGLEESPVAPDEAVNQNEAPPAIRTEQKDAGVRWTISPGVTAVVGVFDIAKPYFNLDAANRFRQLGSVRHRGAEFSIAGRIAPGLSLVAGTVLLDARVSGEEVTRGLIGSRPVGTFVRRTLISLDYRLPWHDPLSLDATFDNTSDRTANAANTLVVPTRAVVNLGARYRFKVGGKPVLVRALVGNVTNTFGWNVTGSGAFLPNAPRRFSISLAADI